MTTSRRTQTWVLALAATASFMVVLDLLVVSTALSTIRRDLGASSEQLEWTVNAYTLSFAVLLMTASALGDRFGRRRVFAAGLALFGLASAACALSPNVGTLIAARAVQGAGAATILPLALAVLNTAFPPERRGWAMGIYGGVTGLAALLGPVAGGAITQGISWQWVFWLNVPIAALAIPFVLTRVPESFGPKARLDIRGLALAAVAAFGVVWGLVRGNAAGWGSAEVLGSLLGGLAFGAAFVLAELRARSPMLPMQLFRSRAFSAGNATVFFWNASLTGAIYLMAQFLQVGLGYRPLAAGLGLLPWGVVPFLLAPRAGALADRVGARPLIAGGLALQTAGLAWIALVAGADMAYGELVAPMTIIGLGVTMALPALTKTVVGGVAMADIGKASGAFSTLRQLGAAFGVAVVVAVFAGAGGYGSPQAFTDGFIPAIGVAAGLAFLAAVGGRLLPGRAPADAPAPAAATTT
ncbi:MAG TPA: DHA2 family efflux MFS transporter permease subunit [Solirubrobacteraceae bacterium]|nr:DHA2 family efflux MFS transporter permease subunit [Solirubrobacteraceae bacterium]